MNVLSQPEKFCVMAIYAKLRTNGYRAEIAAEHAWSFARTHFLKRSRALWWDTAKAVYHWPYGFARTLAFCPLGEALGVERTQGRAQHAKDTLAFLERHYAPFLDLVQRF